MIFVCVDAHDDMFNCAHLKPQCFIFGKKEQQICLYHEARMDTIMCITYSQLRRRKTFSSLPTHR